MIQSIVKFSQVEDRLDAEYYKPEYLAIDKIFRIVGYSNLGNYLSDINRNPMAYGFSYVKEGIPLLRGVDIKAPFVDLTNVEYISNVTHEKFKSTAVFPGDLVMTVRGTIGQVGVIRSDLPEANISPNLIYLRPRDKKIVNFLAVFLNSTIGQSEIMRIISGSVQGTIIEPEIVSIKIPKFTKEKTVEIANLVEESFSKNKIAKQKYQEAQEILKEYLKIDKKSFKFQKTFSTKFSEIEDRFDSEYYKPKYHQLFNVLQIFPTKKVNEIKIFNQRGVQPEYIVKSEYKVLTSQYIEDVDIAYDSLPSIPENVFNKSEKAWIKFGDILTYTTGAYVGRTQVWMDKRIKALASNHVNILRVKDINPFYLGFFLNSLMGQLQFQRLISGAAQAELYPTDIDEVIIPILAQNVQEKIADLVHQSHEARKKAKELLKEAKRKVEEIIQK